MVNKLASVVVFTGLGLVLGVVAAWLSVKAVMVGVSGDEMSQGIAGGLALMFVGAPILAAMTLIGFICGLNSAMTGRGAPDAQTIGGVVGAIVSVAVCLIGLWMLAQFGRGGSRESALDTLSMLGFPALLVAVVIAGTGTAIGVRIGARYGECPRPLHRIGQTCARCRYNLVGTLGIECPGCGATIPAEQCRYLDRLQAKR